MKNTLKKISIILILLQLIFTFFSFSHATDSSSEVVTTSIPEESNSIMDITTLFENNTSSNTTDKSDSLILDNQYIMNNEDTVVDYNVSGDVYIMCNGKVTISSTIYGNVFVLARELVISETGYVSSLYSISESATINGSVDTTIYSVCKEFNQSNSSTIWRDIFLTAETVKIDGTIERNANISGGNVNLLDNAHISGDFNYSSKQIATISEGARIDGNNKFTIQEETDKNVYVYTAKDLILDFILSTIKYIVVVLAIFFLLKWLSPKSIDTTGALLKNDVGLIASSSALVLFLTPIAAIILLFTRIATSLSFIAMILYVLLLMICTKFTIIGISQIIKEKLNNWKCNDTLKQVLIICGLVLAYKLLKLIPGIGFILHFAMGFFGLGIMLALILPKKENKDKNEKDSELKTDNK